MPNVSPNPRTHPSFKGGFSEKTSVDLRIDVLRRGNRDVRGLRAGFTLMEVLVAISILAIISGIVYESFAAVTDATESARLSAEQLRLRQFLVRSFQMNFSTVYVDPLYVNEQLQFIGISEQGAQGAMDSVDFCSSGALMGGTAPPGVLKHVHYGAVTQSNSNMSLEADESDRMDGLASSTLVLETSESLVVMTPDATKLGATGAEIAEAAASLGDAMGYESPTWSVPISGLEIMYFDGEKWQKDWDSYALGRLPWCVRVRINFAKTKEEESAGGFSTTLEDNADFELYVPIPLGAGVLSDATAWQEVLAATSMRDQNSTSDATGTGKTSTTGSQSGSSQGSGARPSATAPTTGSASASTRGGGSS